MRKVCVCVYVIPIYINRCQLPSVQTETASVPPLDIVADVSTVPWAVRVICLYDVHPICLSLVLQICSSLSLYSNTVYFCLPVSKPVCLFLFTVFFNVCVNFLVLI